MNRPATGTIATAMAMSGYRRRRGLKACIGNAWPLSRKSGGCRVASPARVTRVDVRTAYWIAWAPPEGEDESSPVIAEVFCQIVPVVFVKKYRVPVEVETGFAHA